MKINVKHSILLTSICFLLAANVFIHNYLQTEKISLSNQKIDLPDDAETIFERKTYDNAQLINDSSFDFELEDSPWQSTIYGDEKDIDGNLGGNQANYKIIGEQGSFSYETARINNSWVATTNPNFPTLPDSYTINENGAEVSHYWNEGADQSPSVHWEQNFSTDVNMSDYDIISASVSGSVNGTADWYSAQALGDPGYSDGVECPGDPTGPWNDTVDAGTQHATYDYVRFYILLSDIDKEKTYELAWYQTVDLGQDDPIIDTLGNTLLNTVSEETLIIYLTSVLSANYVNFTATIGMRIWCEDNWAQDSDNWTSLIFRNFSLNFEYQKKIDQTTAFSWNQTGYKLNDSSYTGDNMSLEITSAVLNFNYEFDHLWTSNSNNSEIQIKINDILHTETIKLKDVLVISQSVKNDEGFDVIDYIDPNEDIKIEIICYLADNFNLDSNTTLFIDNVVLNVNYTIIEQLSAVSTDLSAQGALTRQIEWNTTFEVFVNYSRLDSTAGIEDANISVSWLIENEETNITELGNGLYKITAHTENCSSNAEYPLQIRASSDIPLQDSSLLIQIQVIGKETDLDIIINDIVQSDTPIYELPIGIPLNISSIYSSGLEYISEANYSLIGSNFDESMYSFSVLDGSVFFLIDTWEMNIGTHVLTLIASEENYETQSISLRITLLDRDTSMQIWINGELASENYEFESPYNENINLTIRYADVNTTTFIEDAELQLTTISSQLVAISEKTNHYEIFFNTSGLSLGQHYITISAGAENYDSYQMHFTLNLIPRSSILNISYNQEYILTESELNIPITTNFTLTANFYDNNTGIQIIEPNYQVTGISTEILTISQSLGTLSIDFDTESIGLGFYTFSIRASYPNQTTLIRTIDLTIRQIQTKISTENVNNSYTILPGSDLDLTILVESVDFNTSIANCSVRYQWEFGSGELENIDGVYRILLEDIPAGIYPITITVYKGQNYNFDQFTIIVNSIDPEEEFVKPWMVYSLGIGLAGVTTSFIAYQAYFKYPKVIRKLNKVKRAIKKGKPIKQTFATSTDLFKQQYQDIIQKQGLLKFQPGTIKPAEKLMEKSEQVAEKYLTSADQ